MSAIPIRFLDHYKDARETLLQELKKITIPKITKTRYNEDGSIKVHQRDLIIGNIGRTENFGFGLTRRKGWTTLRATIKHPELMKALVEYGNLVVPEGFFYNMITLNHGVKAKKHLDKLNVGNSVIVGIGDYKGGALRLYEPNTENYVAHNICDTPILFNGAEIPHETEDFEGDRYTMIFYSQKRRDPIPGYTTVGVSEPTPRKERLNLLYAAQPRYGGWVSFTAHMALKYNLPLYKIATRTERNPRRYGYGVKYTNIASFEEVPGRWIVTAIDKHYYHVLDKVPYGSVVVVHDPTEVKSTNTQMVEFLKKHRVVTIRETVKDYLQTLGISSKYLPHPFYEYPITRHANPTRAVSICRIDFDKNVDVTLKANQMVPEDQAVHLHGAANNRYAHFKLENLGYKKFYRGSFEKSFEALNTILHDAKYVVDMSSIKNDGGGMQYTTMECIYQGCAMIMNCKWTNNVSTAFKNNYNCYIVESPEQLADIIQNADPTEICQNATHLLEPHLSVDWIAETTPC